MTVQENETVVDFAVRNRHVKVVEMGIEVGKEGYTKYQGNNFDPSLKFTRRILPHLHNMDGFYLAKLKKLDHGPRVNNEGEKKEEEKVAVNTEKKSKQQKQEDAKKDQKTLNSKQGNT